VLRTVRNVFDISIKDLSYFTKIPSSTLSSYDSEVSNPTKDNLKKLCEFFGLEEKFFIGTDGMKHAEYEQIWDAKERFVFNHFGRSDKDHMVSASSLLNKRKTIADRINPLDNKQMEYIDKILYCLDNQNEDKCRQLLDALNNIKVNNEDINIVYQEYIYRVKDKDVELFKENKDKIQDILRNPDYNTNKLMLIRFNKRTGDIKKGYYFYTDGCEHFGWSIINRINSIITDKYDSEYKHIIKVNWQHNNEFSDRITLFKDGKNDYAEILEDWSVV
jgi:transcriptional regulator with XRE-family HTH domain